MISNLKIALIIITLLYIILTMKEIKNKKIQISNCTFWIISEIILIIAILIPNFIEFLTRILGFEVPANMLFCITIFVAFYLIFNLTIKFSRIYQDNIHLVQEVSIMKKDMEDANKKIKKLEDREDKDDRQN